MRFSLQDMVRQTLAEAERREKTAAAGSVDDGEESGESKKSPEAKNTPPVNPATAPDRNEQSVEEKTSAAFVSKLANAVEYLNSNWIQKVAVGEILPPPPAQMPTAKENVGAGKGPGAFATNLDSPTPGEQSTAVGQATAEKVLPKNPPMGGYGKADTNPGTLFQNDIDNPPGGSESWKGKDVMKQAAAIKKIARVRGIMRKMAGDVPPDASAAEEDVPGLPSEAARQANMVRSMQSAINYTKQQAKAVPKDRMGEVLDEPAQKKTQDPVLHNNLEATSGAGVKISSAQAMAARALLQKIAEEGAKADASSEEKERASRLADAVKAKQEEKEKASQGMGMAPFNTGASF